MQTDDNLRLLRELLLSVTDKDGMLLSEFDGYCAGVIVCPEMIPPSEWLPNVWGAAGTPDFRSGAALRQALNLIMNHYNHIARALVPPEFNYAPVLDRDTCTDEILWHTWVSGFERAMSLRVHAWERIVKCDNEEAGASVTMMLALLSIAEGESNLPEISIEDMRAKAPELITDMVIALSRWSRGYRQSNYIPPAKDWTIQFPARIVDLDKPCSCGSGRNYDRCCGAN